MQAIYLAPGEYTGGKQRVQFLKLFQFNPMI
jgi:hypothetical protein